MTKVLRQQALLDLVQQVAVASQGDIVKELARRGIATNQATVSRDLQELGLVKVPDPAVGHRYALPGAPPSVSWKDIAPTLREHVAGVDGNEWLLVVKTPAGRAHLVGVAVDTIRDPDIVGTVAGDDTLLVVPRDPAARRRLQERIMAILVGPERPGSAARPKPGANPRGPGPRRSRKGGTHPEQPRKSAPRREAP